MTKKSILLYPSFSYIIINKKHYLSGSNWKSIVYYSFTTAKEKQIMIIKLPDLYPFVLQLESFEVQLL